jgi:predicted nucleic acid-binding protein
MKFVIDANIIFSSIISGKTFYIELLTQNKCFAPDFIFDEIKKYEKTILKKTKIKQDFQGYIKEIFSNLIIIPKDAITINNWKRAFELCSDIDEKDTPYIALAIELDIPLITRDKKLHDKLIEKGFKNTIVFDNIFNYLNNH